MRALIGKVNAMCASCEHVLVGIFTHGAPLHFCVDLAQQLLFGRVFW